MSQNSSKIIKKHPQKTHRKNNDPKATKREPQGDQNTTDKGGEGRDPGWNPSIKKKNIAKRGTRKTLPSPTRSAAGCARPGGEFFDAFWSPLGSLLAPFWLPLAHFWLPLAPFWLPCGSIWAPFGSLLAPFGSILVPFGSILVLFGSISEHFRVILQFSLSFWFHFRFLRSDIVFFD